MPRPVSASITRLSLLATLLVSVAACTQEAALVELKGQNTYGPNGSSTIANSSASASHYASNLSSESMPTVASAPVATVASTSIGVSDLSAPTASSTGGSIKTASAAPAGAPFKQASATPVKLVETAKVETKPENLKPAAGHNTISATNNVNPWTHKTREVELKPAEESAFNLRPQPHAAGKAQMVSEVQAKPASEASISKLDSIIGNEGSSGDAKAAAEPASVAVAKPASSGYIWPVSSKKVISGFGPKGNGKANDGVNIASSQGEPVWAVADGEVVYVGNELKGYGNMVLIKHAGNQSTTYAHLSRANVDKYDRVRQGDIIGYVGSTGNVKEPQLHFAVRDGKDPVDPVKFMKQRVASLQ